MAENISSNDGYNLMAAVFEVHSFLGGGLSEEIYQESLEIEFRLRNIEFVSKQSLVVSYKEIPLTKRYFPDLVVFSNIIVELKAVSGLLPEHEAQLLNYMRLCNQGVGYLINFAPLKAVEWKRFVI